jgi:hypothetical protein
MLTSFIQQREYGKRKRICIIKLQKYTVFSYRNYGMFFNDKLLESYEMPSDAFKRFYGFIDFLKSRGWFVICQDELAGTTCHSTGGIEGTPVIA